MTVFRSDAQHKFPLMMLIIIFLLLRGDGYPWFMSSQMARARQSWCQPLDSVCHRPCSLHLDSSGCGRVQFFHLRHAAHISNW